MSELYRGVLLGFGLSCILISLIIRGFIGLATSHGRRDQVSRIFAWLFVFPFIGLGAYLIGLGISGA